MIRGPSLLVLVMGLSVLTAFAESDPAHMAARSEKPAPWPGGIVPYDLAKLSGPQQALAKRAMQRWMETGARITFVPHTNQLEYVNFTGNTNAGNNTSQDGFRKGARVDVNITAFWWRQAEWMPAHELGHVLGFHHEHQRWDRDQFVTIHYEHIKPGREHDYDWVPKPTGSSAAPHTITARSCTTACAGLPPANLNARMATATVPAR